MMKETWWERGREGMVRGREGMVRGRERTVRGREGTVRGREYVYLLLFFWLSLEGDLVL